MSGGKRRKTFWSTIHPTTWHLHEQPICLPSRDAFSRQSTFALDFFSSRNGRALRVWKVHGNSEVNRATSFIRPRFLRSPVGLVFLFRTLESRFAGTVAAFVFLLGTGPISLHKRFRTFWPRFSCHCTATVLFGGSRCSDTVRWMIKRGFQHVSIEKINHFIPALFCLFWAEFLWKEIFNCSMYLSYMELRELTQLA